jgi:hypothetical protein
MKTITIASSLAILLCLAFVLAHSQPCLKSCDSALDSVFVAAQGHQCVQLTISSLNGGTSSVRKHPLNSISAFLQHAINTPDHDSLS